MPTKATAPCLQSLGLAFTDVPGPFPSPRTTDDELYAREQTTSTTATHKAPNLVSEVVQRKDNFNLHLACQSPGNVFSSTTSDTAGAFISPP
jgi:hypothetical protein